MKRTSTIQLKLSTLLAVLIFITATAGVVKPAVYDNESFDRQVYFVWHDYVSLFIVIPVLFVSGYLASKGRQGAQLVWGGTLLYILRTYSILTFTLQENTFFLFHCSIFAISLYVLGWLVYTKITVTKSGIPHLSNRSLITAAYLIVYAASYYLLTLWNTAPALYAKDSTAVPFTFKMFLEPIRVFDMPVLMPLLFIAGLMLTREKNPGRLIAPMLLMNLFLLHLTVAGLDIVLYVSHMRSNLWIAFIAICMCIIDVIFLRANLNIKRRKDVPTLSDIMKKSRKFERIENGDRLIGK